MTTAAKDTFSPFNYYYQKIVQPIAVNLARRHRNTKFAIGVYCSDDAQYEISYSTGTMCKQVGLPFCYVDCSQLTRREDLKDFYDTILGTEHSVIVLDRFDEIPDSEEKENIWNLLITPWLSGKIIPRERYLVIFVTHVDNSSVKPALLEPIKRLKWLGNVEELG